MFNYSMLSEIFTLAMIGIIAIIGIKVLFISKKGSKPESPIYKNHFMTNHEKTMFYEILQSTPECFIFPQVSFGAILKTKFTRTRNRFMQKRADFVITDRNFNIIAVIELDDNSHNGKEHLDAQRDAMLKEAGYKILRYRYMPDKEKLRNDILS